MILGSYDRNFYNCVKKPEKKIQDFNGAWTRDLAIPVRRYTARSRVQAPLKSWIFFQASLRNCKNWDHKCEDHSSFDFISAVHIWFISYA